MKRFFIIAILLCTLEATALRDGLFFKGADEAVSRAGSTQHLETPSWLLPSGREHTKILVKFARQMGDYDDTAHKEIPLHHQMRQGPHTFAFPQDPMAALVQTFYPMPDGDIFVPNQAALDSVPKLTSSQLGQMLRIVRETVASRTQDHETTRSTLLNQLIGVLKVKESVQRKYERYLEAEQNGGVFDNNNIRRDLLPLRKLRLAHLLADAAVYEGKLDTTNSIYTDALIERTLVCYAWDKATDLSDIDAFYAAALGIDSFSLPQQFMTKADFDAVYERLNGQEEVLDALDAMSSEEQALALYGSHYFDPYDFYFESYSTVSYRGKSYANCVETSISNFFMSMVRTFDDVRGIVFNAQLFPDGSPVQEYFQRFSTMDAFLTPKARQAWSELMVERPGVRYVKRPSPDLPACYELYPGIQNIYTMLLYMMGHEAEAAAIAQEGVLEWHELEKRLTAFMRGFSREGFDVDLNFYSQAPYNPNLHDYTGALTIEINEVGGFDWLILPDHAYLEGGSSTQENTNWRQRYVSQAMQAMKAELFVPTVWVQNAACMAKGNMDFSDEVCKGSTANDLRYILPFFGSLDDGNFQLAPVLKSSGGRYLAYLRAHISRRARLNDLYADRSSTNTIVKLCGVENDLDGPLPPLPFEDELEKLIRRNPRLLFAEDDRRGMYNEPFLMRWAQERGKNHLFSLVAELNWSSLNLNDAYYQQVVQPYKLLPKLNGVLYLDLSPCFTPDQTFYRWFSASNVERVDFRNELSSVTPEFLDHAPVNLREFSFSITMKTSSVEEGAIRYEDGAVDRVLEKMHLIQQYRPTSTYWLSYSSHYEEVKMILRQMKESGLPYRSFSPWTTLFIRVGIYARNI